MPSQLKTSTATPPKIEQCWKGRVAGHSFVYAAIYTPDWQGYQLTVDGSTEVANTLAVPLVYQFSGDYACTGSGAAAWLMAIDLATMQSYNAMGSPEAGKLVTHNCALLVNPAVIHSKYVIGIHGDVPIQ